MRFAVLTALTFFTGAVNAHFRLFYPGPRGPFNGPEEVNFCGGYTEVTTNRTTFPLSGGFFTIRQGHNQQWTGAVLISTQQSPNNFEAFNGSTGQQFARYWASSDFAGNLCIPLDLQNTNITGVRDGANVTIQVAISAGDGTLYQCADLTLSSNYTILENITSTCANTTSEESHGSNNSSGALSLAQQMSGYAALIFALSGTTLALL